MKLRALVAQRFGSLEKCYGHCDQQPTLKFLNSVESLVVGGYSCHAAYLSMVVVYAESLSVHEARYVVQKVVSTHTDIADEDIRVESMYPWDLDMRGEGRRIMTAAYWAQNYRGSRSEDPHRPALFLCGGCHRVFAQTLIEKHVLCSDCRSNRSL